MSDPFPFPNSELFLLVSDSAGFLPFSLNSLYILFPHGQRAERSCSQLNPISPWKAIWKSPEKWAVHELPEGCSRIESGIRNRKRFSTISHWFFRVYCCAVRTVSVSLNVQCTLGKRCLQVTLSTTPLQYRNTCPERYKRKLFTNCFIYLFVHWSVPRM